MFSLGTTFDEYFIQALEVSTKQRAQLLITKLESDKAD